MKEVQNTAPRVDDIPYCMLYNLPENGKNLVIEIFNDLRIDGQIIDHWKNSTNSKQKPNKNPNDAESYCGIYLL